MKSACGPLGTLDTMGAILDEFSWARYRNTIDEVTPRRGKWREISVRKLQQAILLLQKF